jgi:hypothetical protein
MLKDSHSTENAGKNYFGKLIIFMKWMNKWQTKIHTAELSILEQSVTYVNTANQKLKHYKSLSTDLIPTEPTQADSNALHTKIHKLQVSI